ncbi:leginsulin related MtN11/16/17 family [Medicago truncatula]|uniref:Leginsulin related MtN11/16/17 family n=1 Tax=Medicago truncatula TaxID=3880 RepID=A0A072UF54_MEDTR|nr:leginsulin related MtN11/16/17 family [Medicago truncatula]
MTYVKLATLAVFMLTIFLIVQTKNVQAGQCPSAGRSCYQLSPNACGDIEECICHSEWLYDGGICKTLY